jgi:hypothetical protein
MHETLLPLRLQQLSSWMDAVHPDVREAVTRSRREVELTSFPLTDDGVIWAARTCGDELASLTVTCVGVVALALLSSSGRAHTYSRALSLLHTMVAGLSTRSPTRRSRRSLSAAPA